MIYHGCSVRLVALFESDPAPFRGMRNVALETISRQWDAAIDRLRDFVED